MRVPLEVVLVNVTIPESHHKGVNLVEVETWISYLRAISTASGSLKIAENSGVESVTFVGFTTPSNNNPVGTVGRALARASEKVAVVVLQAPLFPVYLVELSRILIRQ